MSTKKVLVIDDEDFIRELVRDFLELEHIQCDDAANAKTAAEMFSEGNYNLVLLDVNLGKSRVEDVIPQLKGIKPDVPIVLLTGDPQYDEAFSKEIGADGIILKPFQVDSFITHIGKFINN